MTSRRLVRAASILAALGATFGTALDAIHTHFGATAYAHPVAFRAAWWVPPLFAGAFCVGLLRPLGDRLRRARPPAPAWSRVALSMSLFVIAYLLSVLPLPWPTVAAILAGVFAVSWWLCDRSLLGLSIAAGAAVGGPLVESALVARGLFVHLHPAYLGVSGWLPALYLCAAVALCTLAQRLVDG